MRTVFVAVALAVVSTVACFAQSNELLDELMKQDQAEFGYTLYVALSAADLIDEHASVQEAYSTFQNLGWRFPAKSPSDPVSAGELAFLMMKSLDLRGGIMYSILPSPRYAYRELVYRGILPRQLPAGDAVSGEQVLRYLGVLLRSREAVR